MHNHNKITPGKTRGSDGQRTEGKDENKRNIAKAIIKEKPTAAKSTCYLLEDSRLVPEGVLGGHPDHAPALGRYCRQDGNCICQTVAMVRHYPVPISHESKE